MFRHILRMFPRRSLAFSIFKWNINNVTISVPCSVFIPVSQEARKVCIIVQSCTRPTFPFEVQTNQLNRANVFLGTVLWCELFGMSVLFAGLIMVLTLGNTSVAQSSYAAYEDCCVQMSDFIQLERGWTHFPSGKDLGYFFPLNICIY